MAFPRAGTPPHPDRSAAKELSDRAADSVGRRYDGTKEAYEHAPEQVDPGDDDQGVSDTA